MPRPQDSAYWPLWPMRVATLWLALDDVTEENGAMEMFRFSDVPQTRNQNLNVTMVEETGADFFIKIDQDVLDSIPSEKSVKMTLRKVSGPTWKISSFFICFDLKPSLILIQRPGKVS